MRLSLRQLDLIPYITEKGERIDQMKLERPEQLLASLFVKPNMRVLELGGRYGTVSCVINNILDDAKAHVVVEPDASVIQALKTNRSTHQAHFDIFQGVVTMSATASILAKGYETTSLEKLGAGVPVPRKSFKELEDFYKIKFNCLFADCEGAFPKFLKENLDIIAQFELIIFEADGGVNYFETHSLLQGMRFKQILNWGDHQYVYLNIDQIWPKGMKPLD